MAAVSITSPIMQTPVRILFFRFCYFVSGPKAASLIQFSCRASHTPHPLGGVACVACPPRSTGPQMAQCGVAWRPARPWLPTAGRGVLPRHRDADPDPFQDARLIGQVTAGPLSPSVPGDVALALSYEEHLPRPHGRTVARNAHWRGAPSPNSFLRTLATGGRPALPGR
jgi:hypothetical protein